MSPEPSSTAPSSTEQLVRRYFAACTDGDPQGVAACFTDDAVVHDVNHRPVVGAQRIGEFYGSVREQWGGAAWRVDTFVGDERGAAIEWTMTGRHDGVDFAARGSEHYAFRGGLVAGIRQYWRFDPDSPATGLVGFDYAADPRFES